MKRISITQAMASTLMVSMLGAQTATSTSDWDWKRSHPTGLTQGGPLGIFGWIGWTRDGVNDRAGILKLFTPNEQDWGGDYLDAPKALDRMHRMETPGYSFEYITLSGQSLPSGFRVLNMGNNSGALYCYLDHYEPGRGFRIYRNGILIHEEFFNPEPLPPRIEMKELGSNQVEWWIQRDSKILWYQVRVSWDEGHTWIARGLNEDHVVLTLEDSRRKPGILPLIEFQIAQGFVITTKRYVVGKGFVGVN